MPEQPSEERSLPASKRKLREARKKGQVAQSGDFLNGAHVLFALGYLFLMWPYAKDKILQFYLFLNTIHDRPFHETIKSSGQIFFDIIVFVAIPILLMSILIFIATGMASTFGPVFSTEPLKPQMSRINPVDGFKRIFSARNMADFIKGTLKIIILVLIFFFLLRSNLNSIVRMPICGADCVASTFYELLVPIVVIAAIAFVIIGMIDLLVQRALFLREMRMTKTEMKQETKNQDGNPLVRREQKRRRTQAASEGKIWRGMQHANLILVGDEHFIGVRYIKNQTPIPVVVSIIPRLPGQNHPNNESDLKATYAYNSPLVLKMSTQHRPGDRIRRDVFGDIADILVRKQLS